MVAEKNEETEICITEVKDEKPDLPKVKRGRPRKADIPVIEKQGEPKVLKKGRPKGQVKEVSLWRDNRSEYFRQYYHNRPTGVFTCPHCSNTFTTNLKLLRHQRCSVICMRNRATVEASVEN